MSKIESRRGSSKLRRHRCTNMSTGKFTAVHPNIRVYPSYQLAAWPDDVVFRMQSGPCVYLLNGQNGLRRIGNSSGLRCPTDASLGSITLRNDSARTLAMVKWYPLRHPMVKPYPRRPLENYLYLPYIFKKITDIGRNVW